ncbi:MAG: SufD family Fe-S cluster assembly protein, partial [Bacteroidetes bacterium]|nr:SufD family Fe-S cluster assembly protein [Bacteroidota bacterium]
MSIELNHYTEQFQAFQKNGAAKSPSWVNDVRNSALSVFTEKGFPTTKLEDWKYTNVAPIARAPFRYSSAAAAVPAELVQSLLIGDTEQHLIVFVNGHFSAEHSRLQSLPAGLTVKNLIAAYGTHADIIRTHLSKYAPFDKNPFTALNTAFINDGAFIHAAKGTVVETPVHLLFISTAVGAEPVASHIRNLIIAEEGAKIAVAHSFASAQDNTNLTNVVTEVMAKQESVVELVKVQRESERSYHVE